jgi:hypothetical protein
MVRRADRSQVTPATPRAKTVNQKARQVAGLFFNYLAFIKLASIRIWLRAHESAP